MDLILQDIKRKFPGRERQLELLYNLYCSSEGPFIDSLFIYGSSNTGKSSILTSLLSELKVKHVFVDLVECYTPRILFETILNRFTGHKIDAYKGQPYAKAENMMDFISHLKTFCERAGVNCGVIILDNVEQLRNSEHRLLPAFLRLRELAGLNISVVLLSKLVFEKYVFESGITNPVKLHFPQYSQTQLVEIMALDYDFAVSSIYEHFPEANLEINVDFFKNYISIFLSVFYRCCRDLAELRYNSKHNFIKYCEPIAKGDCKIDDSVALWKNVAPILKSALDGLYLRIKLADLGDKTVRATDNLANSLELPFYAKYLLIAAYIASYNPCKEDKRLFMKYHGRKTKSVKDIRAKNKTTEQLTTKLGPKPFSLDRLLAIFYSILEEKVEFNNKLLVQVSSLVELRLLSVVSDSSLDGHKYKCDVGLHFIQSMAKMLGFNVNKYLTDFN